MMIYSRNDPVMCLTFPSLAWRMRHHICFTLCFHPLSTTSRMSLRSFSHNTPFVKKPSETIITSSPRQDETGRQPQIIHQLLPKPARQSLQLWWGGIHTCIHQRVADHAPTVQASFKNNVTKMSEVLSRAQPSKWARSFLGLNLQNERGPFSGSTFHPVRRGDEGFLQIERWWREVELHLRNSRHAHDRHWGQPPYKKQAFPILPSAPIEATDWWNASLPWSSRSKI